MHCVEEVVCSVIVDLYYLIHILNTVIHKEYYINGLNVKHIKHFA